MEPTRKGPASAPRGDESSAELWGYLFENRLTGLPRRLYWAMEIDLPNTTPKSPRSAQIDWLTWPVRRWIDLEGRSAKEVEVRDIVEASVYVDGEHVECGIEALEIGARAATTFVVHARLSPGLASGFEAIDVTARADFEGIFVVGSLLGAAHSRELAAGALEPFLLPLGLEPPSWDRFRYVFAPAGARLEPVNPAAPSRTPSR